MATLTPSPPKVLTIKNPGGVPQEETAVPRISPRGGTPQPKSGTTAPSGASVAGDKLKDAQEKASKAATPYNALSPPYANQEAFEDQVRKVAQAEYKPELNNIEEEERSQEGLTHQREADNTNIYNQYMEAAQKSMQQAREAEAEIAARNGGSTSGAMQALSQAIGSTSNIPNPQEYTGASVGSGAANATELAAVQSSILGQQAENPMIAGANRAEAGASEAQRAEGVMNKLAEQRQKLVGKIPDITSKVRAELQKEEDARENLRLERELARQKLGLEGKKVTETAKENERKLKISEEQGNQKLNIAEQQGNEKNQIAKEQGNKKLQIAAEQLREKSRLEGKKISTTKAIDLAKIETEREKIAATASLSHEKLVNEAAKIRATLGAAEGKRALNAITIMENYMALGKYESPPKKAGEPPEAGKTPYHPRTSTELYNLITTQGGLEPKAAYQLMRSSGNPEIDKWAEEKLRELETPASVRSLPTVP